MRRRDLVRHLERTGCVLIRHGRKQDWYQNPTTRVSQPVPRHNEISDNLAKRIMKMLQNDE